ncbi:MAG: AbrB/MazE/SpoVT family DNA-binding domain-containing protein [Terriglobales bacterium]
MPKVTSKLQLTVPKVIADQYGIRPGDELQWIPTGETIRVIPPGKDSEMEAGLSLNARLDLFDKATARQRRRERESLKGSKSREANRGWKREDLYTRGLTR